MRDKKAEIKRIVIFFILAVMPVIIISAVTSDGFTNPYYADMENNMALTTVAGLSMLSPAVAVLLTRLITKEGFGESYLALNFNGNAKYYIASVTVPLINNLVGMICLWLFFFDTSFSETFKAEYMDEKIQYILLWTALSVIVIPHTFGEEWGWRGYMMPKLLKLMNKPAAVIVGGIIWGLWHAPLTVIGHNFGVNYHFFPWLGIAVMCLFCTLTNAFMTFITERTKSIYPTCFIHGIINNLGAGVMLSIFADADVITEQTADIKAGIELYPAMFVGLTVMAIISMILFCRKEKA